MDFREVARASADVAAVSGRLEKIERLAALLRQVAEPEIEAVIGFLTGEPRQGKLGVGHAAIRAAFAAASESTRDDSASNRHTAGEPTSDARAAGGTPLSVLAVDESLTALAALSGPGSGRARAQQLSALVARTADGEREFFRHLLYGELRQGALEGVLIDAVAKAADVPSARVRRATMMSGGLGTAARAALFGGSHALDAFGISLMTPVKPMLADSADDVGIALVETGDASLEYKLDGARIQVHKSGDEVRLYSRALHDVTLSAPELVAAVRALPVRDAIFDGEAIALRDDGTPLSFQDTMRRFAKTRSGTASSPLTPFLFDCLYLDGTPLIDEAQERRASALRDVAAAISVPQLVRPTVGDAEEFVRIALAKGHEGVMAKSLASPYAAGRRGSAWLKIKRARTLDLVVLAVEWGSGRRQGFLSNIHLGARDPATNSFVMLGKTFKGMTDATLAWQTAHFQSLEIGRDGYTVYVRPETVVEIAFNDVQRSSIYPGGVALRFARVKQYRPDKKASEADTIDTVRALAPESE